MQRRRVADLPVTPYYTIHIINPYYKIELDYCELRKLGRSKIKKQIHRVLAFVCRKNVFTKWVGSLLRILGIKSLNNCGLRQWPHSSE